MIKPFYFIKSDKGIDIDHRISMIVMGLCGLIDSIVLLVSLGFVGGNCEWWFVNWDIERQQAKTKQ